MYILKVSERFFVSLDNVTIAVCLYKSILCHLNNI